MQAQATWFRTALASVTAAVLALVLGASFWPASGQDVDTSADSGATSSVDTNEFEGLLYANPETGCIELPPEDLNYAPHIVPVQPEQEPGPEGNVPERGEDDQIPHPQNAPKLHAEPWPACNESDSAKPIGESSTDTDG